MEHRKPTPKIRSEKVVRNPRGAATWPPGLPPPRQPFGIWILACGFRFPAWTVIVVFAAVLLGRGHAAESESRAFRLGFSSAMFTDVNENDAKASVRVWGQALGQERGVHVDPNVLILKDIPALLHALRTEGVDALALPTTEYDAFRKEVPFAPIFVSFSGGRFTEQYVLMVHQDSGITSLADLRGRSLAMHRHPRASLAEPWLDTLLVQAGLKPAALFFGKTSLNTKLSKVVLPVFFRQTDVCVAPESGFRTMAELNPQVGKQLKVLATSSEFLPALFCFRADYASAFKEQLFAGIRDLHKTPAGQQVLTIFQAERIEEQPPSRLDSTLELLATHRRLCAETNNDNVTPLAPGIVHVETEGKGK